MMPRSFDITAHRRDSQPLRLPCIAPSPDAALLIARQAPGILRHRLPSHHPSAQVGMSLPDPFNDSLSFRAGQQHMQRRISELLRQRRTLIQSLPARSSVVRALGTELDVIIRAVDALTIDGQA